MDLDEMRKTRTSQEYIPGNFSVRQGDLEKKSPTPGSL